MQLLATTHLKLHSVQNTWLNVTDPTNLHENGFGRMLFLLFPLFSFFLFLNSFVSFIFVLGARKPDSLLLLWVDENIDIDIDVDVFVFVFVLSLEQRT